MAAGVWCDDLLNLYVATKSMKHPQLEIKTRSLGFVKVRQEDYLDFEQERVEGVDFSGRKVKSFGAHGCKFSACKFENLRLETASFGSGRVVSEYIDCSFDGLRFRAGLGGYARFERCSFRNVDLREWFCFAAEMVDCTFSGKMRKVIFNGTPRVEDQDVVRRKYNEFRGNDFSEVNLEDVGFRSGIDLSKQKLPTGPDYVYLPDAEGTVRRARAEVLEWKDMELRRLSMILIGILEGEIAEGKRQLLFRAADYSKSLRLSADTVGELLKRFA